MIPTFLITTARSPRTQQCMEHLATRGVQPQVYTSQSATTVAASINAAHREIVRIAQAHEWPYVCVMEDDCYFSAEDGWQYFLKQWEYMLENWILLSSEPTPRIYSACNYHSNPTVWTGAHCYIIHAGYYEQFLSTPPDAHIDSAQPPNTVTTPPLIAALQRPGHSANNREFVDHNRYLKPEQVYGGIPEWSTLPDALPNQLTQ